MQITEANRATRTDEQRSCLRTISIKDSFLSNWGGSCPKGVITQQSCAMNGISHELSSYTLLTSPFSIPLLAAQILPSRTLSKTPFLNQMPSGSV